ncbi:hypothetical protein SAMN05421766_10871 [Zobellia uliginosa]|uniref:Uncharacterized protein n=1 Tax=Zobellia uliginosa TaxID=143224 RepID=A0ABY1L108_9FLAO|nr:hypothetical protein SAMN05421766_10871 [Zobellia uliginosa]
MIIYTNIIPLFLIKQKLIGFDIQKFNKIEIIYATLCYRSKNKYFLNTKNKKYKV